MHLLVALWATTAILGQLITVSATTLVIWRTFLAAVGGALVVMVFTKKKLIPPMLQIWQLLGIGGLVGLHWMCFFGAIRLANVSICLAGMATISFFTALTEPWLDRRRVRPLEVIFGLLILVGILSVAGFERGRLVGLMVALLGAFLAAVFPVLNRRLIHQGDFDPRVMMVWEMAGACLICLCCLPFVDGWGAYEKLLDLKGLDWLWLTVLAWVCTVFAFAFHIHLLRYLSAYTGNLALSFEPVYGIMGAAFFFGEHRQLNPWFFVGTGTIIIVNIAHALILEIIAKRKAREIL